MCSVPGVPPAVRATGEQGQPLGSPEMSADAKVQAGRAHPTGPPKAGLCCRLEEGCVSEYLRALGPPGPILPWAQLPNIA